MEKAHLEDLFPQPVSRARAPHQAIIVKEPRPLRLRPITKLGPIKALAQTTGEESHQLFGLLEI